MERKISLDVVHVLLNDLHTGAILVDEQEHVVFANKRFTKLFGFNADEILGHKLDKLVTQETYEKIQQICKTSPSNLKEERLVGITKEGNILPIYVTVKTIDMNGKMHFLISIIEETKQKLQNDIFHKAFQASPTAMLIVNKEGKIVFANFEVTRLFGYEKDEMLGQEIEMFLPEAVRSKHVLLRSDYIACPIPRQMGAGRDLYGLHKFGYQVPVEIGLNPIKIIDSVYIVASINDISYRVKEQKLKEKMIDLERTTFELDEFTFVSSHNLQEPLRKIQSFADLLLSENSKGMSEEAKSYVKQMADASLRVGMLINDLLTYSQLNSLKMKIRPLDPNMILDDVIDEFSSEIKALKGRCECHSLTSFEGDEAQISHLFRCLISNAIKFHHCDTSLFIQVKGRYEDDHYVIDFIDNGIGFDLKYVEKIFMVFQRLHPNELYPGSGIGLALCKKIIKNHNGEISVKSEVGVGSTFSIKLPLKQPIVEESQ